jgi:lysozyme family protein
MRTSLPAALAHVLRWEGGWADDPADPGGCTKYGITLATWRDHGHPRATCAGLRNITKAEAQAIYTATYWAQIQGDPLPAGVDLIVFDQAVNAGPVRAVRLLQQAVGAVVDGDLGPKTRAAATIAVVRYGAAQTIQDLTHARLAYYRGLAMRSRKLKRFLGGWTNRTLAAQVAALALVE